MSSEETKSPSGAKRNIVLLVAFLAVIGGGIWLWFEVLEDRIFPKRWGVVVEGKLYRSGQLSSALVRETLEKHKIKNVIDFTNNAPKDGPNQKAEREAIQALGIKQHLFFLQGDGTGNVEHYVTALGHMHRGVQSGEPTLVHCAAGAQRTGAAVAFYRLLFEGRDSKFILNEMTSYDWDPVDDVPLIDYINTNLPKVAEGLVKSGALSKLPSPLPKLAKP